MFRFFFWLAVTVWLVIMGIYDNGWSRWTNFFLVIIVGGLVIENALKATAYFRKDQH